MTSTSPAASAWYLTAGTSERTARNRIPYACARPGSPSGRPMKSGVSPAVSCGAARARSLRVASPYLRGGLPAHRDGVGVLEAKRWEPAQISSGGRTRATRGRTPAPRRPATSPGESPRGRCRCIRGRRRSRRRGARRRRSRWRRGRAAARRRCREPRAICANISPRRYDSPNGFEATTTAWAGRR